MSAQQSARNRLQAECMGLFKVRVGGEVMGRGRARVRVRDSLLGQG